MNITNRYDLPAPYCKSVSQVRVPQPEQISVTELLQAPQARALHLEHWQDEYEDASDRWPQFIGEAVHDRLAIFAGSTALAEETLRWRDPESGWLVHGTPDHLDLAGGVLTDWKTTTVEALAYEREEWEAQLNLYAHLVRLRDGQAQVQRDVSQIQIWAILRDWKRSLLNDPEYPRAAFVLLPQRLWDATEAHAYLLSRLRLHIDGAEGIYGPCSADERWMRSQWAVWSRKGEPQRASKVTRTRAEAVAWAVSKTPELGRMDEWHEIDERVGKPLKCLSYCPVSRWCVQHEQYVATAQETLLEDLAASVSALPPVRLVPRAVSRAEYDVS